GGSSAHGCGLERMREPAPRECRRSREDGRVQRFFTGTFAPALRACESPIAMACFLSVTRWPDLPDRSLPFFISCSARPTFRLAAGPYLVFPDMVASSTCGSPPSPRSEVHAETDRVEERAVVELVLDLVAVPEEELVLGQELQEDVLLDVDLEPAFRP